MSTGPLASIPPISAVSMPAASMPAAPVASATKISLDAIHNAAQQASNLRMVLQDDKQRIGFFLGAGCPLGIFDASGKASIVLIPAVAELTKRVAQGLESIDKEPKANTAFKKHWDSVCEDCKIDGGKEPTVEDVLTELRMLANRRGKQEVGGMKKDDLVKLDEQICILVTEQMRKTLPAYRCSYNRFASWIGGVHRTSPIEVFTPNYDLLFEQAFEQQSLPHFDGFVGSREPWFDLASIEHDTIPSRWTRLWKLHGSTNWEKIVEDVDGVQVTRVVRVTREAARGKVMIFPSHLKYDQSRRMPYLALLDRLKAFFHGNHAKTRIAAAMPPDDAPRLVVCGYSFLDDHLNEVLLDGLRGNRSAHCFALMHSNLEDNQRVVDCAKKQGNLTVLAKNGAVIGTRVGLYCPSTHGGDEHKPWLDEETILPSGSAVNQTRSHLGDFHYFGLFLEQLCGVRKQQ